MFAIVSMHSAGIFSALGAPRPDLVMKIVTPYKFGTIAFFLVSGFLAGDGLYRGDANKYLRRRISRIVPPWSVWFVIQVIGLLVTDLAHRRATFDSVRDLIIFAGVRAWDSLLGTAFWFVPNLVFSLTVLFLFRSYWEDVRFGATLLAINLLYGLNIYANWVATTNAKEIFGFILYLWLGVCAARYRHELDRWVNNYPLVLFGVLYVTAGILAYCESMLLLLRGSVDPVTALRLTNQVFSVVAVLFIYRFRVATWPRFINVRENSFGIYLVHGLVLLIVFAGAKEHHVKGVALKLIGSGVGATFVWFIVSILTYFVSLMIVRLLLSRRSLRWTMGMKA